MKVIVSGPTNPGQGARTIIRNTLMRYQRNNGIVALGTGCAKGVDTLAAVNGLELLPDAEHHLFIPAAPSNIVVIRREGDRFVEHLCQSGRTDADSYGIRNEAMCRWAKEEGVLLAFPNDGREVQRGSGTWWTVRIAGRMQVPCVITPLDGSPVERLASTTTTPRADWL